MIVRYYFLLLFASLLYIETIFACRDFASKRYFDRWKILNACYKDIVIIYEEMDRSYQTFRSDGWFDFSLSLNARRKNAGVHAPNTSDIPRIIVGVSPMCTFHEVCIIYHFFYHDPNIRKVWRDNNGERLCVQSIQESKIKYAYY